MAKKIAATRSERDSELPVPTARRSVESYLTSWIAMVKPAVKANTWRSYEDVTHVHLIPDLGKKQLATLTPEVIQC